MRVYQYLKSDANRIKNQVLELNEFFSLDDQKFIVHNEVLRNYMIFDTYAIFKQWFANNPDMRTLHEVIRGDQAQKLKFDIDAPADALDTLEDMPCPIAPAYPCKYGIDIIDDSVHELYISKMESYTAGFARWNLTAMCDRKAQHMFNRIIVAISKCFLDLYGYQLGMSDLALSNSTDFTKYSRHIVITTYHVIDSAQARFFTARLMDYLPIEIMQFVDSGVNKSTQNFRMPECSKVDSNRVKVITRGAFDDMVITQIAAESVKLMEIAKIGAGAKLGASVCTGVDAGAGRPLQEISGDIEIAVIALVMPYAVGHIYKKCIGTIFIYHRQSPSDCHICGRVHDKDNTLYASITADIVYIHCRHSNAKKSIGIINTVNNTGQVGAEVVKVVGAEVVNGHDIPIVIDPIVIDPAAINPIDPINPAAIDPIVIDPAAVGIIRPNIPPKTKRFNAKSPIPAGFTVQEYCQPTLQDFQFCGTTYDTLLIKSGMGTGKTKALLDYINLLPLEIYIVFVSFRRSFTTEIKNKIGSRIGGRIGDNTDGRIGDNTDGNTDGRIGDNADGNTDGNADGNADGNFVDYRDIKGPISNSRVIIQFESLHRLTLPIGRQSLLVLDESESIINQIENKQMVGTGTLRGCWEKFEWLVKHSTKVIAMDAFADYRTYLMLNNTRTAVLMHHNTYMPPPDRAPTDIYYSGREDFLAAVYAAAVGATDAPFVVVSSVKKQSDAIAIKIRSLCPGASIKSYSSDSTGAERLDFNDVNAAWATTDVLIYTSTISAGCSFELPRFTKIFAYFSDQSCDYKTAIQMLGRVRNIDSREYHIYIKYSGSDFPDTIEAVERAIAVRAEIASIDCNPLEMPKMINATGVYEYSLKDLYYHLHVGNIVHRCQSRNQFRWLFRAHRADSGALVVKKPQTLSLQDTVRLRAENQAVLEELGHAHDLAIAGAMELQPEELAGLKGQEILTQEQKNSVIMHSLADCYHVAVQAVTPGFVKKYNKPKVKSVFRSLNYLMVSDESIADAVVKWRQMRAVADTSVDDLPRCDNMLKCMFAVDILNALTKNTAVDYCREFRHFQAKSVTRAVIEANIDGAIVDILAHVETIALLFDIRQDSISTPRTSLKTKLELVNTVINGAFGVKIIAATGAKRTANTFMISKPKLFHWDGQKYKVIIPDIIPIIVLDIVPDIIDGPADVVNTANNPIDIVGLPVLLI